LRFTLLLVALVLPASLLAQRSPSRDYGRSMVISRSGIVATSQTLASEAGASVLEHGGNAVDAAIAANAALGVTEPMMNGIGGDLFAIVYDAKTKKIYGLNSSGWAPAAMSISALAAKGFTKQVPASGIFSVTVPGAVAGWSALHDRFGKLPLSHDLAPAIYYAENGVPVTEMMAKVWVEVGKALANSPGFAATFLPGGKAPGTGDIFRDADLAESLRRIAEKGRDGFYDGPTADAIVSFSKAQGGFLSKEDLTAFQPEWVEPISTTYRGWTVFELPPNSQGIAALSMLNIMERFPLAEYGQNSAQALHVMIEAKKLAYADLAKYIGDPRFGPIPVKALLSKELAAKRAKLIQDRAQCQVLPSQLVSQLNAMASETTYLSVIDRDGNIVSLIQSNFNAFGSGLVAPGTGFVLQNRGALFSVEPNLPNSLAPRKRPLHTIIPAFMEKGDVKLGFGIMGGFNQAQAHAQFVSNVADFGMNIQAALEAARFTKLTFEGCDLLMESRVPESVRKELAAKGHQIQVVGAYSLDMGRGNAVMRDGAGVNFAASDPRADGEAIPEAPPWFRAQ
jgi:gamma-glutamyltranspeptidase/glutathione hydrolase